MTIASAFCYLLVFCYMTFVTLTCYLIVCNRSSMVSDGEVVAFLLLVFYWLRSNRRRLIRIHRIRDNDSSGYAYKQDLMYGDPTQCFDMTRIT